MDPKPDAEDLDGKLAKVFRFVRGPNGQVTGVQYDPTETLDVVLVKKAMTETFSTYFHYTDGAAAIEEVGVSASRKTDYSALSYDGHYSINANYDGSSVTAYAPGSTLDPSSGSYTANTDALVDVAGVLKNSFDRTSIILGNSPDSNDGPGLNVHAASDCVFSGDIDRLGNIDANPTLTPLAPLLAQADGTGTPTLARRDPSIIAAEVGDLLATLGRRDAAAARRAASDLVLLARREPAAAAAVIDHLDAIARRTPVRRGESKADDDHLGALTSALAASRSDVAHLRLVAILEDGKSDANRAFTNARLALNFVDNASDVVVARVSDVAVGSHETLPTLGSLLRTVPADKSAAVMKPHADAALASGAEDHLSHLLVAVANMGERAGSLLDVAADIANDHNMSSSLRAQAVKVLRAQPRAVERRNLASQLANFIGLKYEPKFTTSWASADTDLYDMVEPLEDRKADVARFNKASVAGLAADELGWQKLNIRAAGGGFAGLGAQGCLVPEFKGFMDVSAKATVFGKNYDLLDAGADLEHTVDPPLAKAAAHVKVNGKMLLSEDFEFTCKDWVFPLVQASFPLVDFTYSIPIYIASIDVGIDVTTGFKAEVDLTVCAQPSAKAALKPTVSLAVAGSGGATVLALRGKIVLGASVDYSVGPEVRALWPTDGCKVCVSLDQGWDPATFTIDAEVDFFNIFKGGWRQLK
ncbi:hypothetical protein HK101_005347, partial [Irineochytrium annulatum]